MTHEYSFMHGGVMFHSRIYHLMTPKEFFLAEISFHFVIPFFNGSWSLLADPATQLFQSLEYHHWLVQFEVASLLRRGMAKGTNPSHRALWVTAGMSLAPKVLV